VRSIFASFCASAFALILLPSCSWKSVSFSNTPPVPLSVCLYLYKNTSAVLSGKFVWTFCKFKTGHQVRLLKIISFVLFRQLIVQPTFIVIHLGYSHDKKSKITESGSRVGTKCNFLLIPTHWCTDHFKLWIVFTFALTISMAIKPKIKIKIHFWICSIRKLPQNSS